MNRQSFKSDPMGRGSKHGFRGGDPPSWMSSLAGLPEAERTDAFVDAPPEDEPLNDLAADHWWLVGLKGVAAVALAIIAATSLQLTLATMVMVFAAYCFADALFSAALAFHHARQGSRWVWQAIVAVIAAGAGATALAYPRLTIEVLLSVLTAWAILAGIATVFAAARLKRDHGRDWLIFSGIVLLVLGLMFGLAPALGLSMIQGFLAGGTGLFGLLLIALSIKLRAHRPHLEPDARTETVH